MKTPVLKGIARNGLGKNFCKKVRRDGLIPAVIYGSPNKYINLDESDMREVLRNHGENALIELNQDGNITTAMIKEVQKHPTNGSIYHIDFKPVAMDETISSRVPIKYSNTSAIKKQGGIIQSEKDYLKVEGKAKDIPKNIDIDLSKYSGIKNLKVKDIELAKEISINENIEGIVAAFVEYKNTVE